MGTTSSAQSPALLTGAADKRGLVSTGFLLGLPDPGVMVGDQTYVRTTGAMRTNGVIAPRPSGFDTLRRS